MRGEVEIWEGDNLLYKEPNMLVDGAGELLADVMTVSPSLSGIADTATSSILDASNYTIQAISFGTGSDAFRVNGHALDTNKENYLVNTVVPAVESASISLPSVTWLSSINDLSGNNNIVEGKAYHPVVGLPTPPNPILTVLEENTSISSTVSGIAVSSVFPGNGQLTNFMPSAILSALMEPTVFSSTTSAIVVSMLMGAFPDGSSGVFGDKNRHFVFIDGNTSNPLYSPQFRAGVFNEVSSMDVSGFVNNVMSSVPHSAYSMSSTYSGLCMSANSTFASDGIVEYSVTMAAGDVGYANNFGGIFHLGLWTIDMKQSLLNGNTPPFAFSVLNNPRKYKLFARKGLSNNLCYINDNGVTAGQRNYTDLTIKWRLHFL